MLENDTSEKFQRILALARDTAKQCISGAEGIEQIQIHPIKPGSSIQVRIPEAESDGLKGLGQSLIGFRSCLIREDYLRE